MPFEINHPPGATRRPGARELTALLAGLMALNAFAIDAMIPALPAIGAELGVAEDNRRQLVVVGYMLGFGATQLIWGPLADRFGRKPILAIGVALYAAFALLCGIADSFALLIGARILQGASAAVTRVLVVAMVRDLFEAEAMARVMSLVFMVFMLVPVVAPSVAPGAFTGELALDMLLDTGCKSVILGHSERRALYGETDAIVNKKVHAALAKGLQVLLCVGESLEERKSERTNEVLDTQMAGSLAGVTEEQLKNVVIAYEPVWAIGTGLTASPAQAQAAHAHLRNWLLVRYNAASAVATRILYGGSVKPDNALELLARPDVDGALVGGASLKPELFVPIIEAAVAETR